MNVRPAASPLVALLVVLFAAFAAPPARAQRPDSLGLSYGTVEERQSNSQGYFFWALPGEATKQVAVWGTVRIPGVYVVSANASMSEVLSLAGGPLLPPITDRNIRTTTIRLYHSDATGTTRTLAYEAPMEQMMREPGAHPMLRTGDVIEVESRDVRPRDYRDTLSVVGSVGTLAVVVLQIVALAIR